MIATLLAAPAGFPATPAPALAFLEGIGTMEMLLVAVIGLLLFGGKGLPDMARTVGKVVREFKKASASVEDEVKRVMNEDPAPVRPRPAPPRTKPVYTPPPAALPTPPDYPSTPSDTDRPPPSQPAA